MQGCYRGRKGGLSDTTQTNTVRIRPQYALFGYATTKCRVPLVYQELRPSLLYCIGLVVPIPARSLPLSILDHVQLISQMASRRSSPSNKYYPPDFDPTKIPLRNDYQDGVHVRIMSPLHMQCNTCGEYLNNFPLHNLISFSQ